MAEPLGLVGSLIAIVQISSKVVAICYEYRRSVLNAPREISQILDEVASIRNIVERLVKIANDDEQAMALPSLSSMNQPDAPLARCLAELTSLKSRLKLEKGLRAKGRALIWPFKEVEVHKSLDNIRRIKGTLQLAISADSASVHLTLPPCPEADQFITPCLGSIWSRFLHQPEVCRSFKISCRLSHWKLSK